MTARLVGLGLVTMAAMVLSVPGASQGATGAACTCAQPPAKAQMKARTKPVVQRTSREQARSMAYAEGFYNYWQAAPVSMRGWHGEWQQAPDDWMAPAAYAGGYAEGGYAEGAYYGPPPAYEEQPGLTIDRSGWSGGVGGYAAEGGGGGYGQAIIARGGGGLNGPTYNDYGQSFQYNPSRAGPWLNRVPASSGSGGGSSGSGSGK